MNKQGNIGPGTKKSYNRIHVHAHGALDLQTVVTAYRVMDVNDQSPPTVQEPLEKGIYIKKTEAGAF